MKSHSFQCDKLIRTKAGDCLTSQGAVLKTRVLSAEEIVPYLKKKIEEEAREARQAKTSEHMIEELMDAFSAGYALLKALGIDQEAFLQGCKAKDEKEGSYEGGLCLTHITLPEGHPKLRHYQNHPEKYTEISEYDAIKD
jgi:predicted house-cleaning noncanonical NTP pyrophosphatase (MazG superfamily)